MSRIKPAEVRYYIDADILGLARVLAALRPDVTYPGDPGGVIHARQRPPCTVPTPHEKDTVWLRSGTGGDEDVAEVAGRPAQLHHEGLYGAGLTPSGHGGGEDLAVGRVVGVQP